jgi:hypothetical protein
MRGDPEDAGHGSLRAARRQPAAADRPGHPDQQRQRRRQDVDQQHRRHIHPLGQEAARPQPAPTKLPAGHSSQGAPRLGLARDSSNRNSRVYSPWRRSSTRTASNSARPASRPCSLEPLDVRLELRRARSSPTCTNARKSRSPSARTAAPSRPAPARAAAPPGPRRRASPPAARTSARAATRRRRAAGTRPPAPASRPRRGQPHVEHAAVLRQRERVVLAGRPRRRAPRQRAQQARQHGRRSLTGTRSRPATARSRPPRTADRVAHREAGVAGECVHLSLGTDWREQRVVLRARQPADAVVGEVRAHASASRGSPHRSVHALRHRHPIGRPARRSGRCTRDPRRCPAGTCTAPRPRRTDRPRAARRPGAR